MKKYDAYKDSGVKWIGEIPNHWEAIKISRVHPIIGSGTTPLSSREDYYSEKGLNWLQTGDFYFVFRSVEQPKTIRNIQA